MKTGIANLPLHGGKAPSWLFKRMVALSREITIFIVSEYGSHEFLRRISHPVWFQSLGCVLGFDWHSSGLTTTTCGALKEGIKGLEQDLGLFICGGKGGTSRKTPQEIANSGNKQSLRLIKASKLSAKVDNTALQDGFQLYHHNFFFDKNGNWAVVQQGMNSETRYARRYHWLSDSLQSFVNNPHQAIVCNTKTKPLNLVAKKSRSSRQTITEISKEKPDKILKEWKKLVLLDLPSRHYIKTTDLKPIYLEKVLLQTYQEQAKTFSDVLLTPNLGPKTLRALTLLAEVLAGAKPSFEDPVQYSFAHGGKDGIPYPVDRELYDQNIEILRKAISKAKVPISEKKRASKQLDLFYS
ncbi:DUF763 domain-containing protein [Candidatus Beckwithbacteria bacterium]|nr:DUF763 domain-containing protein [Candidatus Beckwithbacteria bacterium]